MLFYMEYICQAIVVFLPYFIINDTFVKINISVHQTMKQNYINRIWNKQQTCICIMLLFYVNRQQLQVRICFYLFNNVLDTLVLTVLSTS